MNWRWIGLAIGMFCCAETCFGQQGPTFYGDVWPIVQQKCTPCHRQGGSAPFPLEKANDLQSRNKFIDHVIGAGYMPPWPADPNFTHFKNENLLSTEELNVLRNWLAGDMAIGEAPALPKTRRKNVKSAKGKRLLLKPKGQFVVPGDGKDHFVYFLLDTKVKKDLHITDIEFHPGNRAVVHHMELLSLPPRSLQNLKACTISDSAYFGTGFDTLFGRDYTYLSGWLPGNQGEHFPKGSGLTLEKNSRLVLMVHYAPTPIEEQDQSNLELFLQKAPPTQKVESIDLHTPEYMRLPAGSVQSFRNEFTLQRDFHAFAIFPHAHHLCIKMEAYAISPHGDTLPMLRIPNWDFDWQFTYYYPAYLHLPKGSKIVYEAVYDNSSANPENPYSPPRDIPASFRSKDEMMELFVWGFYSETSLLPKLSK